LGALTNLFFLIPTPNLFPWISTRRLSCHTRSSCFTDQYFILRDLPDTQSRLSFAKPAPLFSSRNIVLPSFLSLFVKFRLRFSNAVLLYFFFGERPLLWPFQLFFFAPLSFSEKFSFHPRDFLAFTGLLALCWEVGDLCFSLRHLASPPFTARLPACLSPLSL